MKKLILILSLISTGTFAANIYCPQTITCTAQGCIGIPENFYISSGNPSPNNTYSFQEASDASGAGMDVRDKCSYGQFSLGSRIKISADRSIPGNRWIPTGGGKGIYACLSFANTCPFK